MFANQNSLYMPIWENPFFLTGLFAVILLLLWFTRRQYLRSAAWKASECPKCGSEIHRIHRTEFDHFLSKTLLPEARRYRCENPDCRWDGLRQRRAEEPHRHRRTAPASQ
jgi:uncharacterized protein with PIN domain